jgi:predicted CXXCH cytochrome family protein
LISVTGLMFCAGAIADVRETAHNLIRPGDKTVDEKGVCVFCHTPFGTDQDVTTPLPGALSSSTSTGSSPRWQQKSMADDFVFAIYDDIGRLGLGKPSVGSQSIACLSCHDSSQAFGIGRTSSDHPFGVPYRGALKRLGPAGQVMLPQSDTSLPFRAAQHLKALEDFRDVSQGTVENRSVFWVSREGVTARRTRGDLPLYPRQSSGSDAISGLQIPHIECSSCHDPHTRTQTFLRVAPEGSKLCLTCHDK